MLGLFPHPYPDELIYSILARYSVRAGYSQYIFVAEDLFQRRSLRPNFEYLPALKDEVVKELTKNRTLCEVILNHTMFPYYCRFLPIDRKRKAINSLVIFLAISSCPAAFGCKPVSTAILAIF